jgi:hypothetical protein
MVKLKKKDGKLFTYTPYNKNFISTAKNLNGKWNSIDKCWVFDERDESDIKDVLLDCFGVDGTGKEENCCIILKNNTKIESGYRKALFCGPVEIARAYGRDSGAKMSGKAILKNGNVDSAGSLKNWYVSLDENSTIELRDIPLGIAKKIKREEKCWASIDIIEPNSINPEALKKERERLVQRIKEIDSILKKGNVEINTDIKNESLFEN